MNTELLLKVKAHILEEPRRLWMSEVLCNANHLLYSGFESGQESVIDSTAVLDEASKPPCGTVGCIAGWSCKLDGIGDGNEESGADALRLSFDEAHKLFYVTQWPQPFRTQYSKCRTAKRRAKVTADRIDHFIATGGRE